MARDESFDRRTVLRGASGVLLAGVLAGCSGGSSGEDGTQGSGESTAGSGGETATGGMSNAEGTNASETAATKTEARGGTSTSAGTDGAAGGASAQVEQYLAEAKGYDGSVRDMTGKDTVEISVGAGGTGFAFDPAAVRVSPGTTVRWTWSGEGGAHNVISKGSGPLDSGQPQTGGSVTYEETLDQPGTYRYYCEPHRTLGMKGAVVVADSG